MPVSIVNLGAASGFVRFRQPFITEGTNKQQVGTAKGIYQGGKLETNGGTSPVAKITADPGTGQSVMVYERSSGGRSSLTVTLEGDLLVDFSAQVPLGIMYVALFVQYTTTTQTVVEVRAYTEAELFGGAPVVEADDVVVFGQVDLTGLGAGDPIPASAVTPAGRREAWLGESSHARPWKSLVMNGDFELGSGAISTPSHLPAGAFDTVPGFSIFTLGGAPPTVGQANVRRGEFALEYAQGAGGIAQVGPRANKGSGTLGIRRFMVRPGQLVHAVFHLAGTSIPAGMVFPFHVSIEILFHADSGAAVGSAIINDLTLSGTFSYTRIERIIEVPALTSHLSWRLDMGFNAAGVGTFYVDDVNVFVNYSDSDAVEQTDFADQQQVRSQSFALVPSGDLGGSFPGFYNEQTVIHDNEADSGTGAQAPVRTRQLDGNKFDWTIEADGEFTGDLDVGGDLAVAGNFSAADLTVDDLTIGGQVTFTNLLATVARMVTTAVGAHTLLWESIYDGVKKSRLYVRGTLASGGWELTTNARYDGANWIPDDPSVDAWRFGLRNDAGALVEVKRQPTGASWADTAWTVTLLDLDSLPTNIWKLVSQLRTGGTTNLRLFVGTYAANVPDGNFAITLNAGWNPAGTWVADVAAVTQPAMRFLLQARALPGVVWRFEYRADTSVPWADGGWSTTSESETFGVGLRGIGVAANPGVRGIGGTTNGIGVEGFGDGASTASPETSVGVYGRGGASGTGTGVLGFAGGNGVGIKGFGAGTGDGGYFQGGSSNGRGIRAVGDGTATGGYFEGGSSDGRGVEGFGDGDAVGGYFEGGSNDGRGVRGQGVGAGEGGYFEGGNSGTGAEVRSGGGAGRGLLAVGGTTGHGIRAVGGTDSASRAIDAESNANDAIAIYALGANGGSGPGIGVYGESGNSGGNDSKGVVGVSRETAGNGVGVYGETHSSGGTAVWGSAVPGSGGLGGYFTGSLTADGCTGISGSSAGSAGVRATALTGSDGYGVFATGGDGNQSSENGASSAVFGFFDSGLTDASAIYGLAPILGSGHGIHGKAIVGTSGAAIRGRSEGSGAALEGSATAGTGYGLNLSANSDSAHIHLIPEDYGGGYPTTLSDGDIWHDTNGSNNTLYTRVGGQVRKLAQQTPANVNGARDDPEDALFNLLSVLHNLGLINDNTTVT